METRGIARMRGEAGQSGHRTRAPRDECDQEGCPVAAPGVTCCAEPASRGPSGRSPGLPRADMQLQAARWQRGGKNNFTLEGDRGQRAAPVRRRRALSSPQARLVPAASEAVYLHIGYIRGAAASRARWARDRQECARGLDNPATRAVGATLSWPMSPYLQSQLQPHRVIVICPVVPAL